MSNENPFAPASNSPVQQPPPSGSSKGWLVGCLIAAAISVPVLLVCGGILVALLLPAVQAAREAARRMECSNNMKQIGLALYNYETVYSSFPPAYTVDEEGRPLHSWRTLILPYMEQQALYEQIDLTRPWDDPVNQAIGQTVVKAYACPSRPGDPTMTTYVAVVDPAGIFMGPESSRLRDITDGTSNTLLVTETDWDQAVPWMSPDDIDLPTFLAAGTGTRSAHPGGSHNLMGDGAVKFFAESMDPTVREAIVTRNGGETTFVD